MSKRKIAKVSGGARTLRGVQAHFAYIGREGDLGIEMDDGRRFVGTAFEKKILPDWDLDLWADRRQDARSIRGTRRTSKARPQRTHSQHITASKPIFCTRCSSLRAVPVGRFWPISHFCTVETLVFKTAAKTA
jgi:hypothetical protein